MACQVSPASPQPVSGFARLGQRVGDRVEVGRDVQPVQDQVVAGVGHHDDVGGIDDPHQPP